MSRESKPIRKTDDSAMILLHEIFEGKDHKIADVDSYYCIKGTYHFVEFINCKKERPYKYDPNIDWKEIGSQMLVIWDFVCRAKGQLWLACYEKSREQFCLLSVKLMDDSKAEFNSRQDLTLDEFKKWFQKMNSDVLE